MKNSLRIERRAACAAIVGLGGSLLATGNSLAARRNFCCAPQEVPNSAFYNASGKFQEAAAKDAYYDLLERASYPISDAIRKNLWIAEFGLGRFTEVGLGGAFWVNSKDWNYASVEVFLLPWQMIPEHWHVAIDADGVVPKMESWIVRYGTVYACGEGEPTANPQSRVPQSESGHVTARKETVLQVGQVSGLIKPLEKHWLQAGPQGAIVTEVSTFHTGNAIRFTNPGAKL